MEGLDYRIILKNNSVNQTSKISFFTQTPDSKLGSTYIFTLPYVAQYSSGQFFRINVGSQDCYIYLDQNITREDLVTKLNALGFGDWSLSSSIANNIYSCFCSTVINVLEIDYYSLSAPVASAASSITSSSFVANWGSVTGATGYKLDVATDSAFTSMVTGYNNLDVSNVTNYSVTGLSATTNYYYRIRSYNTHATSSNSSTITATTSASTYILAGTSPGALILKSIDNGENWTNEGSAGKGNPLAFCQLSNGDILYTTDTGWVVNYTKGTSVKVSDYAIRTICTRNDDWVVECGDDNGDVYVSDDYGVSFYLNVSLSYKINYQILSPSYIISFTSNGIYRATLLVKSGNFTCAYYDSENGFIYAGTNDGHIWKNTIANDFTAWTDLGLLIYGLTEPIKFFFANGNRLFIGVNIAFGICYVDNYDFINYNAPECIPTGGISGVNVLGDISLVTGSTDYAITVDNGINWQSYSLPFSQSSINCLIKIT